MQIGPKIGVGKVNCIFPLRTRDFSIGTPKFLLSVHTRNKIQKCISNSFIKVSSTIWFLFPALYYYLINYVFLSIIAYHFSIIVIHFYQRTNINFSNYKWTYYIEARELYNRIMIRCLKWIRLVRIKCHYILLVWASWMQVVL